MIGATRIRRLATESGYREQIVEKVLYLEARQLGHVDDLVAFCRSSSTTPRSTPSSATRITPTSR